MRLGWIDYQSSCQCGNTQSPGGFFGLKVKDQMLVKWTWMKDVVVEVDHLMID
jgi:hypothetical protein